MEQLKETRLCKAMWLTKSNSNILPAANQCFQFTSQAGQNKSNLQTQAFQSATRVTVPVANFKSFCLKCDYLDSQQPQGCCLPRMLTQDMI